MHLSLCKPPVLLLYYSTHVVFCLRSAQNLLGGTAFFCRGPARTPFFCRQKPGRKTEVRAKGQAVCSRKAFCSSPKPLLLPSGSLPHRLRAEPFGPGPLCRWRDISPHCGESPSQRGPRNSGCRTDTRCFSYNPLHFQLAAAGVHADAEHNADAEIHHNDA